MQKQAHSSGTVLSRKALNRALLERQLLLRRSKLSVQEALRHLAGFQAQAPNPPYYGLWTRLDGFRQEQLSRLMTERQVVRIALMRSTIHLVTAEDCLMLRPLLQPVLDRGLKGNYGKQLDGIDLQAVMAAGRLLVEQQPRTFHELGLLLQEQWPDRDPAALSAAVRNLVPLVQVPPRGLWGESGLASHTSAEHWLARPLSAHASVEELIRRYLAAFGPASVKDIQVWSGLTRLQGIMEVLRPSLRTFYTEHGVELFDLPDTPLPDPDEPAPPRFLSEFDNMLLSYADRSRIISEEHRKRIFTVNGIIRAAILIDGFARGLWRIEQERDSAVLVIEPFVPLSQAAAAALHEEGARLLAFAIPKIAAHHVQILPHQ
ncbi:winged helix DNA-binding domain-containing protein [Paenibacillus solisilvae]|uniref:Winged helix DNA-binding domain-containing protein n=1 Tax=Paenibacillus solisilvae TaxID=2486751 RepID=A0ABW0W7I1_9BACL